MDADTDALACSPVHMDMKEWRAGQPCSLRPASCRLVASNPRPAAVSTGGNGFPTHHLCVLASLAHAKSCHASANQRAGVPHACTRELSFRARIAIPFAAGTSSAATPGSPGVASENTTPGRANVPMVASEELGRGWPRVSDPHAPPCVARAMSVACRRVSIETRTRRVYRGMDSVEFGPRAPRSDAWRAPWPRCEHPEQEERSALSQNATSHPTQPHPARHQRVTVADSRSIRNHPGACYGPFSAGLAKTPGRPHGRSRLLRVGSEEAPEREPFLADSRPPRTVHRPQGALPAACHATPVAPWQLTPFLPSRIRPASPPCLESCTR